MAGVLLRIVWRVLIFAIGSILLWTSVFLIFPFFDNRLPAYIALLIVYCLFVYAMVPGLIRLFRLVIKPNHIPLYVTTRDGWPSDPVNIAIIAKDEATLVAAMKKAGWYRGDEMSVKNGLRELSSILFNTPYPEAPLSSLYLFNNKQDIGFEIPTNLAKSARTRHHVRFWRLKEPSVHPSDKEHPHLSFWNQKLRHLFGTNTEIWIGAATEETIPIDIQWRTGRLTHGGSHDADRERDFIIQSLKNANVISNVHDTEPGETVKFRGQQFRTMYITDGSLKVVKLRRLHQNASEDAL
jgi:hypothetical protein